MEMFSKLEEDNSRLKMENEALKTDLMKLKKEHDKTKKVLLGVIAFMNEGLNEQATKKPNIAANVVETGGSKKDDSDRSIKSEVVSSNDAGNKSLPDFVLKNRPPKGLKTKENRTIKEETKVKYEESSDGELVLDDTQSSIVEDIANQEDADIMSFLNVPLMNPITRRRLIAEKKLPKPSPNKDALSSLPKYSGPNERRSAEETQRITLSWLSSVEGVILSQDATVQDVYDKLPFLLEENAGIWFRQSCMKSGHFKTWNDFRQTLLKIFLGPDWKHDLERSFATIRQEEKEPGVNYVLRVWSLAKQIDPTYAESAILAKIATSMKPKLWKSIPRNERKDYNSLVEVIAVYDEDGYSRRTGGNDDIGKKQHKQFSPKPTTFTVKNNDFVGKKCYHCHKEGHTSKYCPEKRRIVATTKTSDNKGQSGKGSGALLGTK